MTVIQQKPVFVLYDPLFLRHETGAFHPECKERIKKVVETLLQAKLKNILIGSNRGFSPRKATLEEVALCHPKTYIGLVERECASLNGVGVLSTGDAAICKESYEVALFAIGAVLEAVDVVMNHVARSAFCLIRPPGHHAESRLGMGFCLFNNVACGARYVQRRYGIERVLIVDWDVHHGNGTQEIFYHDPSVFYFSTHEEGNYPGTGAESDIGALEGKGATLNVPIRSGRGSAEKVIEAFRQKLLPAMERFKPQFVLISAGFDGHKDDPLGHFDLEEEDFTTLTKIVKEIAFKYAEGRIVSVLEGGYHLEALARSVLAHVRAL